jgi:hypothetical protein
MAATLGPMAPVAYLLSALAMGLIVLCGPANRPSRSGTAAASFPGWRRCRSTAWSSTDTAAPKSPSNGAWASASVTWNRARTECYERGECRKSMRLITSARQTKTMSIVIDSRPTVDGGSR